MDFRQCPACQASVLDDDATECPFCGASMSGKPSATPKKPAAAASPVPAKVPAKPAEEAKPKGPMRRVGETVADDDDPFGIDTSSVADVPRVAPKPMKGRSIKIECPMCGTSGYISSKMQGKDVKCVNSSCMVPVFKAPLPPKKDEGPVKKEGPLSSKVLGFIGGGVGVLILLLIWGFWLSRHQGAVSVAPPALPDVPPDGPADAPTPDTLDNTTSGPAAQTMTLAEIRTLALEKIITAAQIRDENRKAYGRRLAAEAHALAGDVPGAREQIRQLQKPSVGGRVKYFQIEPQLLIAWHQLAAGKQAEAQQAFGEAIASYEGLSQVGREVLTAGVTLAGAQASFDQIPQAKETLRHLEAERERARLAAALHISACFETFDVDELVQFTSLDLDTDPLAMAVAAEVADRVGWDKAIAWAKAQGDIAAREDALAMLATMAAYRAATTEQTDQVGLMQAVTDLTPTGQTRVQAGLAAGYLMGKKQAEAEAELTKAQASLATIVRPPAIPTPSVKDVYDTEGLPNAGLPASSPLHSSAVAAMQVGRVQALMGQKEAAWATILQAWEFTAGIGPNAAGIGAMTDELQRDKRRTEQKIAQQIKPRNRDEAYRALNQYRGQLRYFEHAAQERITLERALMFDAKMLGLQTEVDAFRANPGAAVASAAGQPYQQPAPDDDLLKLIDESAGLLTAGKYKQTGEALAGFHAGTNRPLEERRDLWAVQLACRLVKLKQIDGLLVYAEALREPWLKEDALELASALCVRTGQAPQLWKASERHSLQPPEKVAIYRGLIGGIVAVNK